MEENINRLELFWVDKYKEIKLEPRILIEDKEKSYGDTDTENMLIHGDNLLALKALEQKFSGQIKCIYIDPPYNTGNAFEHYDDNLEHSMWLNLMYSRLRILHKLLAENGLLYVHLDGIEVHYCKVMLDEIFGRDNYVSQITYERSAVSGIGQGGALVNTGEYILIYKKNILEINEISNYEQIDLSTMKRYNKVLTDYGNMVLIDEFISRSNGEKVKVYRHENFVINTISFKNYKKDKEIIDDKYTNNYDNLFRTFLIQKENSFQQDIIKNMEKSDLYSIEYIPSRGKNKDKLTNLYYYNKELIGWLKDSAKLENKCIVKASKLTNIWKHSEIPKADLPNEGRISFPRGKKPEQLLKRIIEMSTSEGDYVLDSFIGSGTTIAVAHKMNRKWIGIELGEHCYTHCVPRLKSVIDGVDQQGISKLVNWQGGGGFKFYELAPSLLKKDKFGNLVIDERYNQEMLAAAMCKHEGFTYAPDNEVFWKQGYSYENDFIFTTSNLITPEYIDNIYNEMKQDESLLICCKAYHASCEGRYSNINIKKIPQMLFGRCEFAKDDYKLNIVDVPNIEDISEEGLEDEQTCTIYR